jgi:hypothetical protein
MRLDFAIWGDAKLLERGGEMLNLTRFDIWLGGERQIAIAWKTIDKYRTSWGFKKEKIKYHLQVLDPKEIQILYGRSGYHKSFQEILDCYTLRADLIRETSFASNNRIATF